MGPASPSSSAQAAREAVAVRLREIRLDAGITAQDVAVRCGWHKSKSSRIENAVTAPSDADIRAWCIACGAMDQVADLVAASRQADSMYVQWKRLERTGLRRLQEAGSRLYDETRVFQTYCSAVVPGFLQIPEYAQALLSTIAAFRGAPDDVSEAVGARVQRSQVVRERGRRLYVLIEEVVLRYQVADADVMAAQLGHLREAMAWPTVSMGIIPSGSPSRVMWPLETFTIFDGHRVHVDSLTAAITITQPSEVATYEKAFGKLQGQAVHGAGARELITAAIPALG